MLESTGLALRIGSREQGRTGNASIRMKRRSADGLRTRVLCGDQVTDADGGRLSGDDRGTRAGGFDARR